MRKKILIVEDDLWILGILKKHLKDFYDVTAVSDGQQAIDILDKNQFDILICDVVIPFVSGVCIAKKARQANPDMTILMMTGYNNIFSDADNIKACVDKILHKPFSIKRICFEIENLINDRGYVAQNDA